MSNLSVGQMVVCINDDWSGLSKWWVKQTKKPVKGNIYTIRDIFIDQDQVGVRLREIRNPRICGKKKDEAGFSADRFRPVKETNIDSLLKLRDPSPNRRKKLADAKRRIKQFEYEMDQEEIFKFK